MEELNTSVDGSGSGSGSGSAGSWFSELEMEDYNLFAVPECHPNLLDVEDHEFLSVDIASALHPVSPDSYSCYPNETSLERERPSKQQKTDSCNWKSSTNTITDRHFTPHLSPSSASSPSSSPTSQILSFENPTPFYGFDYNPKQNEVVPVSLPQVGNVNLTSHIRSDKQNFDTKTPRGQGTKRSPAHAQDHIMAERKRREKLSQSLIALAALIPGLKKMDKASVLGDAIKYVKELKERLRLLEEESNKKAPESVCVVMINKPQPQVSSNSDDDSSSCDESFAGNEALPHVEARVADRELLLRIHCQNHKGLLVKILAEIQNLHLFVINSSVLPFGDSILDITIVAQMSERYNMTIRDLVRTLRVATLKSMS